MIKDQTQEIKELEKQKEKYMEQSKEI